MSDMSFRFLFLAGVALALASAPVRAGTVPLVSQTVAVALAPAVEYLEDSTGYLTYADASSAAQASSFRATGLAHSDINFGYSASAYWLRFTLAPQPDAPRDWLLEVAFPSLDRIEFYGPRGETWTVGDLQPYSVRPVPNRNFVFPVALAGDAPQTFYLRVTSGGTLTIPLQLWRPDAFRSHNQDAYAATALYFGMLLALALYNLLLYFSIRDASYLSYVLFAASMAVGQMSLNGLGNEYLWPDWPAWGNVAFPVGFAATGFFGALFTRGFLQTRKTAPLLDATIIGMAVLFAFCVAAPAFLPYRYAAIQTSLAGVCFAAVAVAAGVVCLWRQQAGARWFLLAWSLLLAGVAVLGMRNMGWLPTNFVTTYAMQAGSALEMLLLSFALADRFNALRREKEIAQAEALAAKHEAVEVLSRSERELETRIADRTRELEEANAHLRENERQLQAMAHRDPLTGLANRLLLDARLQLAMQQARRQGERVALLLADLDRFKPINDRYGHAIGDEVLCEVGGRLRAAVREVDTVARLGGDEFVIVLCGMRDEEDAFKVAEKVVADMARPFRILGLPLDLGVSVGIAMYVGEEINADELVRRADAAMYEAKAAGRGCYRLYTA
jgi:diguanylate cyclase (GGDEF)-like protein